MTFAPRGFLARALSATVYRRLELMALELTDESDVRPAGLAVEYGFATADDLDALEALRPGLGAAARERFAHDERCFVARLGADVVMARWVARGRARIDFVGLELPLADDEAYGFDTFAAPAARGVGVTSVGGARMRTALRAEGVRRMIRAVWAGNDDGMRNAAHEGFAAIGYVARIGAPGFGRTWLRVPRPPLR